MGRQIKARSLQADNGNCAKHISPPVHLFWMQSKTDRGGVYTVLDRVQMTSAMQSMPRLFTFRLQFTNRCTILTHLANLGHLCITLQSLRKASDSWNLSTQALISLVHGLRTEVNENKSFDSCVKAFWVKDTLDIE